MRWGALVLVLVACGGGDGAIALSFTSPVAGDAFVRDQLGPTGALSALVPIELDIDGAPTRIALSAGTTAFADADADGIGLADVRTAGAVTLTATAFEGEEIVATATVDVSVSDPVLATCKEWLDLYRIDYTVGPTQPGVMDPVTAKMPIN